MSEAKRSAEPVVEPEAAEELDADGKRGRRRSKTMSRKEIARELRRQRAFGVIDPELDAVMKEMEEKRPRSRVRFMIEPTSSSVMPPRSATSSAQVSPISQTSLSGKLSLIDPVDGFTSR